MKSIKTICIIFGIPIILIAIGFALSSISFGSMGLGWDSVAVSVFAFTGVVLANLLLLFFVLTIVLNWGYSKEKANTFRIFRYRYIILMFSILLFVLSFSSVVIIKKDRLFFFDRFSPSHINFSDTSSIELRLVPLYVNRNICPVDVRGVLVSKIGDTQNISFGFNEKFIRLFVDIAKQDGVEVSFSQEDPFNRKCFRSIDKQVLFMEQIVK